DSEVITLFVRVWKKWGVAYEEVDVNLDAISLTGPAVHHRQGGPQHPHERTDGIGGPVQQPGHDPQEYRPQEARPQEARPEDHRPQESKPQQPQAYRPSAPSHDDALSCGGPELIYN